MWGRGFENFAKKRCPDFSYENQSHPHVNFSINHHSSFFFFFFFEFNQGDGFRGRIWIVCIHTRPTIFSMMRSSSIPVNHSLFGIILSGICLLRNFKYVKYNFFSSFTFSRTGNEDCKTVNYNSSDRFQSISHPPRSTRIQLNRKEQGGPSTDRIGGQEWGPGLALNKEERSGELGTTQKVMEILFVMVGPARSGPSCHFHQQQQHAPSATRESDSNFPSPVSFPLSTLSLSLFFFNFIIIYKMISR